MGKKVKVIMNQDVLNMGEEGDIREVAPGYARNYLFPKKIAVPFTTHTLTILGQKKKKLEKRKEEKKVLARGMKEQLEKEEITFTLQAGENGKLFGSITNGHIADELQKRGYAIERKKIEVPEHHLKMTGDYSIKVKLYGDEEATFKVIVKALEIQHDTKTIKPAKTERPKVNHEDEPNHEHPESDGSEPTTESVKSETMEDGPNA
jgi:large subunit ribosomal protein L9